MKKETIVFSSPLEALIEVTKRLSAHEVMAKMDSEEFFHLFSAGALADEAENIEWANDYRHYLSLKQEVEDRLAHAA
jgi:hypothetical protein